jgi:hypothetical protein
MGALMNSFSAVNQSSRSFSVFLQPVKILGINFSGSLFQKRQRIHAGGLRPVIKLTAKIIKKTTNKIHAILVAVPATPDKPTTPAMRAMTRNVMAQLNISFSPFFPDRNRDYIFFSALP